MSTYHLHCPSVVCNVETYRVVCRWYTIVRFRYAPEHLVTLRDIVAKLPGVKTLCNLVEASRILTAYGRDGATLLRNFNNG